MSTKKDKFSLTDNKYMSLALNLARARVGLTGENPSVGCVIVKNNNIISIGQTGFQGRPHAEYNAITNSLQSLDGAKMYVSLEPCNHYGKTPPCTNYIIKSGISEIFYSLDDIDKKVRGKSFKIFKKKKIKVKKGLLKKQAEKIYKSYVVNRVNKLPFVTGKIVTSKNNLIYSKGNKRISDKTSDKLTHYLRYKNDAIMITNKTLNIDNPKLDCRLKGYEKFSPKRIILDKNLEINFDSYIMKTVKKENTIIFYNSNNLTKMKFLKKKGIILIKSELNNKKLFNLRKILKKLYNLEIRNLLVEGGDKLTKNFITERLFDQFYMFKSTKKLSKVKNHTLFSSHALLNKKYGYNLKLNSKLAKDNITIFKK